MVRTVQILGKAPNAVLAAARPGVDRWGCNNLPERLDEGWAFSAWDRWIDRHTREHIQKHRPEAWAWYCAQDGRRPIYTLEHEPEIPGSVRYPIESIAAMFAWGGHEEEFFTSSTDYLMALAIAEGFERIEVYGVDMWAAEHERNIQRNGAHYWIGIARGRGIDVVIPDESSLCKIERRYGDFQLTSPRNFASMAVGRFFAQLQAARAMEQPDYVAPGLDTDRRIA